VDYDKAIEHLKTDAAGYGEENADEKANAALLTQLRLKASNFEEMEQNNSPDDVAKYNADIKNAALEGNGGEIRKLIEGNACQAMAQSKAPWRSMTTPAPMSNRTAGHPALARSDRWGNARGAQKLSRCHGVRRHARGVSSAPSRSGTSRSL
jgi:hypothetical protein